MSERPEWAEYMIDIKQLPGERWVGVIPLIGNRARIVADVDEWGYTNFW